MATSVGKRSARWSMPRAGVAEAGQRQDYSPYISPFQSSGSGFEDRKISRCHLPPPHGSITSAATTSTRISANDRPFGIALEVVGRLVPREARVEHHRQEQVVAVVDDDQLAAGTLEGRVIDQVLLRAVGADVALERELAGDDLLDGDLLVPAVAAIPLLAARLGDFLRAAQRTLAPGSSSFGTSDAGIVLRRLRATGRAAARGPRRHPRPSARAGAERWSVHRLGVFTHHAPRAEASARR